MGMVASSPLLRIITPSSQSHAGSGDPSASAVEVSTPSVLALGRRNYCSTSFPD